LLYDDLRRVAHQNLRKARPDHTLQTTALVHEAYLRLEKQHAPQFQNRDHFVAICALLMRQILTGYERTRRASKRGGGVSKLTLDDASAPVKGRAVDLIALDDALNGLARLDRQQSQIVELRFFGGLSIERTAELLGLSPATVKRHWATARVWLHRELSREMDEQERSAFLDIQCATDPSLRAELNELLAAEDEIGPSFLDRPAIIHAASHTDTYDRRAVLPPGTKLGPYVVQSLIGAGGMGEVYRARDASLKRDVAIKVLPASLSHDPDRLRRFQLEAEAAAALNHPNILSIYSIGQQGDSPYIVTELLEGETLRERLRHGAMRLRDTIDVAIAAAKGLAAAHEKGIAHRDLKPENLFLAKDGRIKILDFGLAKLMQNPASSDGSTVSLRDQTDAGRVLGTVGYMSPEQVRGQPADARSDIFALGCLFYEMLTGKRAFRKPSSVETMNAILNEDPPAASDITPTIPPALQRVVHRCLEKAPERRFQSASDLAFALDTLSNSAISSSGSGAAVMRSRISRRRLLAGVTVFLVLAALALGYFWVRPEPVPRLSNFVQLTHDGQPKGVVGIERSRLYVAVATRDYHGLAEMPTSGGEPRKLPILPKDMGIASLSPDGSQLLLVEWHDNTGAGPLWSVPILGGSPRRLADTAGVGGAWSPDGKKLAYGNGNGLFVANEDGTDSRKLITMQDPAFVLDAAWSPDGTRLRFVVRKTEEVPSGFYWEVSQDGTGLHRLLPDWHNPPSWECCGHWTADGKYFVFVSGDQIWALPEKGGFLHSEPKPIQLTSSPIPLSGPIPSSDGKKLFVIGQTVRGELARYDFKSRKFVPFLGGISAEYVAFSKDGEWVAYVSFPEGTLWRSRLDGSERLQLSYPPVYAMLPRWSPDGKRIVYMDGRLGKPMKIYEVSPQGGSPRQLMPEDSTTQSDPTWSLDGNKILFGGSSNDPASVIRVLDLVTHQVSVLPGSQGLYSPRWSPNGRFVIATPADSTRLLLFDFETQKWNELAKANMGWAEWSKDGQYVYFQDFSSSDAVLRVGLSDHQIERVADLANVFLTGHQGSWLSLGPDDSPLLLRNTGTWDIYSLDWEVP
jgi:RNA polymerase sigma factor (TIGR02999 family)